jgi:hypothetical protein
MISLGLYLAKNLLGASVPADVWTSAPADATIVALADEVPRGLFIVGTERVGILRELRLNLAMKEGKRDKLTSCIRLLATPRVDDWKLLPLPGSLFFLFYVLRPFRLTGKYAAKLLRGSADTETSPNRNEGIVS